ncbi:MAG: 8-oxo-dGTP diphosphatase MutT, partial [Pseudomonadota bacterium]
MQSRQKIVIAVVKNEVEKILVSRRKEDVDFPGFMEFPGGKVEAGESFKQALRRELYEEIGLQLGISHRLIEFNYKYDDSNIEFQVFFVSADTNKVIAKEAQELLWVNQHELNQLNFPPANRTIIDSINLPQAYMVADYSVFGESIVDDVKKNIESGISQIQFRGPSLDKQAYISIANTLSELCRKHNTRLIVNCDPTWSVDIKADNFHLNSPRLRHAYQNGIDLAKHKIFSASCHNEEEIEFANSLGVRAILIGPIQFTD